MDRIRLLSGEEFDILWFGHGQNGISFETRGSRDVREMANIFGDKDKTAQVGHVYGENVTIYAHCTQLKVIQRTSAGVMVMLEEEDQK